MKYLWAGALMVLIVPISAFSQDDNSKQAKKKFLAGSQMFEAGNYTKAAEQFRQAYDLKPSYKILFNIGQSEASANRHGAALEAFEKYLSTGGDDIDETRQAEVRREIQRLRVMTGIVAIQGPDGMVISVDDTVRGTYPTIRRVSVAAGVVHNIQGALDNETDVKEIQVLGGDQVTVHLFAEQEPMPTQNIDTNTPASDSPQSGKGVWVAGISLVGVGGATLVGGAIAGGLALNKENLLNSKCAGTYCTEKEREIGESRDRLAVVNVVLLATGGVIAATGLGLILVYKLKKKEPQVVLLPTINGMSVTGRF